jgi:lipolytic protein G-D-S-L family
MKFARLLAAKNDDILNAPPVTAAFLGDSVTHGCFECYRDEDGNIQTIFEREQSYAAKFAHIAGMLYPRAQLNIVNAGVSGGTAMQAAARLERDVLRFRPDLLVVNFALNDCGAGDRGLEEYIASMKKIFRQGKEAGAEVVYLTPNPMCGYVSAHLNSDFLREIAKDLASRTADGVLDRYVAAATAAAKEERVPVCDCYSVWKNMRKNGVDITVLLANYLNHPTRDMQWLAALKLAEMLFGE